MADNPPATAEFRIREGAIAGASLAWPTVNPPLSVVKTGCGSRAWDAAGKMDLFSQAVGLLSDWYYEYFLNARLAAAAHFPVP